MEITKCAICNSDLFTFLFEKDGSRIVKCMLCGLVFVNPRLSKEELKNFYEESYHLFEHIDELRNKKHDKVISRILKLVRMGRLLDIGCSTGYFLDKAKSYYNVLGIEVAEWSANFARKTHQINVINSTLENSNISSNSLDVVTFFELIEHLHEPIKFLNEVYRILKPGGIIVLSTGNVDSLEASIRGKRWYYFAPRFHLYYFSIKTIKTILRKCGFEIIKITGSEALTFFDLLSLYKYYDNKMFFLKQLVAKLHFGQYSVGCIGIYATKK